MNSLNLKSEIGFNKIYIYFFLFDILACTVNVAKERESMVNVSCQNNTTTLWKCLLCCFYCQVSSVPAAEERRVPR